MKLASLKGGRDGRLAVVSSDLISAALVPEIAPTLQVALDAWDTAAPRLAALSRDLNAGKIRNAFVFDPSECESPLPRAFQWADASAYVNHVELVRKARGAVLPQSFWIDPLMYQGGSDHFLGPTEAIAGLDDAWGIDMEGEVAVITGDVSPGCDADQAADQIRLVMLANDVSLRNLIPEELAKGFGFFQSKPAGSFSPVAVTPDELGEAWREGRLHRRLHVTVNGTAFGNPDAGTDMVFNFPQLIAHAAKTRSLAAGSIIGSGTVSNRDPAVGSACIAERRMREQITGVTPLTPFLTYGDHLRIEMFDDEGRSIFGAIDQVVRRG